MQSLAVMHVGHTGDERAMGGGGLFDPMPRPSAAQLAACDRCPASCSVCLDTVVARAWVCVVLVMHLQAAY